MTAYDLRAGLELIIRDRRFTTGTEFVIWPIGLQMLMYTARCRRTSD